MSRVSSQEFAQIELLAQVDDLVQRLNQWSEQDSAWPAFQRSRSLVKRLLPRVDDLRIRLEAPLIVATFGGTGTGKSSLVNAVVGQECSRTGRQRPTTIRPVLMAHPETRLELLGLPLEDFDCTTVDSPVLRDIVLIDCPDPDTSEADTEGTNLAILRNVLPYCDVLIYTSTQQKYRSARVSDELLQAARGCRLFFVQTHAGLDTDIREDWRQHLKEGFEVPEMFFVDSLQALEEKQRGERPSGDFARLEDRLTSQLAASQRVRVRRANLLDLIQDTLDSCVKSLRGEQGAVENLQAALRQQSEKLTQRMSQQLRNELMTSQNLWERRLLSRVTSLWGFSPFSAVLRFYNGLGSFIASFSFFRARTSAQMALIGAMQGTRWLKSLAQEREAESNLDRLTNLTLDETLLRETHLVVTGYLRDAGITSPREMTILNLDELRREAARVEDRFLGDAGRRIDEIIERQAVGHSGLLVRCWYELLFLIYLAFVLFRVGKNFFFDSFLIEFLSDGSREPAELLSVDFYIPAAIFFALWSGALVMAFTRRLRRGLSREIDQLAQQLAQQRLSRGLFPDLEFQCDQFQTQLDELEVLQQTTADLQNQIAGSTALGGRHGQAVAS